MHPWLKLDSPRYRRIKPIIYFGLPLLFLIILIRNAWVCDDAYITFRTVDNFINGFGLRWNVVERVQTYTNPLWMLVLSLFYYFTREIYFTSIIVSIIISSLAVGLVYFKLGTTKKSAIFGLILLICSKSFMDYTTSGMEIALLYLWLAVFFFIYYKSELNTKKLFFLSLITSLGITTRMDTILLFLPALVYAFWRVRSSKNFFIILLGFIPFILWELFAIFYYGFFFPNTAYAKLFAGVGQLELLELGWYYYLTTLWFDPITLFTLVAAIIISFYALKKRIDSRYFYHSLGIILYLGYILKIGGDFMSGRFFAVPFFSAVILVVLSGMLVVRSIHRQNLVILLLIVYSILWRYSPLMNDMDYNATGRAFDIDDERCYFYFWTGLMNNIADNKMESFDWVSNGIKLRNSDMKVYNTGAVGFFGFYGGPRVYILDYLALGDPLLARLPAHRALRRHSGHFERMIPNGYYSTLLYTKNILQDKNLAKYYDKLCILTRGDLFDFNRLQEIWNFNLGKYDALININYYRNDPAVEHLNKGTFFMKYGFIEVAELEFRMALALDPDLAYAHARLGGIYLHQMKYAAAESEFKIALNLNPDYPGIYNDFGKLYLAQKKYKEAVSQFEQAVRLDPIRPEFTRNLSIALAKIN